MSIGFDSLGCQGGIRESIKDKGGNLEEVSVPEIKDRKHFRTTGGDHYGKVSGGGVWKGKGIPSREDSHLWVAKVLEKTLTGKSKEWTRSTRKKKKGGRYISVRKNNGEGDPRGKLRRRGGKGGLKIFRG